MSINPYQSSIEVAKEEAPANAPDAGLGLRFLAYLIDIIPITLLVGAIFWIFLGFDVTVEQYLERDRNDVEARREFLQQRNLVRDGSFLMYILYCAIMESSALHGTFGKYCLGLRVTDRHGQYLTFGKSVARNTAKIISLFPCGLGFLWALWSKRKQAWHDKIAGTLVIR